MRERKCGCFWHKQMEGWICTNQQLGVCRDDRLAGDRQDFHPGLAKFVMSLRNARRLSGEPGLRGGLGRRFKVGRVSRWRAFKVTGLAGIPNDCWWKREARSLCPELANVK